MNANLMQENRNSLSSAIELQTPADARLLAKQAELELADLPLNNTPELHQVQDRIDQLILTTTNTTGQEIQIAMAAKGADQMALNSLSADCGLTLLFEKAKLTSNGVVVPAVYNGPDGREVRIGNGDSPTDGFVFNKIAVLKAESASSVQELEVIAA